jgi:hypothetical protein
MPTTLGPVFTTDWRGSPPHMLPPDIPVWYRFLEVYGERFLRLYYDCLLGGPWLTPEQEKDSMWRMWRANQSKRADAIAELQTEVWIIEVAKDPGLRAVGQLQVYRSLWIEDPKILKPERMILVFQDFDRDLVAAAAQHGIQCYSV